MFSPIAARPSRDLTSAQALDRTQQFDYDETVERKLHLRKRFLKRCWALVPWLLKASIILPPFLGESVEALAIGCLLLVNATLSCLQDNRTQKVLQFFRQLLRVHTRERRNGE
jgi:H+-transporting ATPase